MNRELSYRKLKALGTALESSYTSIQKLALEHLNKVIQALMFRLGDLAGFAEWQERFEAVGLVPQHVDACNRVLGSLALKSSELVRIIGTSIVNFKVTRPFGAWEECKRDGGKSSCFRRPRCGLAVLPLSISQPTLSYGDGNRGGCACLPQRRPFSRGFSG